MSTDHYFDDPDEGPARETSHPRFRDIAAEAFYYDCTDDFSPFGNDDGADTLAFLEDWYREGGRDDEVAEFLDNLLENWDLGVPPEMLQADSEAIEAWGVEGDMHENFLQSVCNAWVATAFGQLKISGKVDPDMRSGALSAIECQVRLNHIARKTNPAWQHADANLARLVKMRDDLVRA